MPQQARFTAPDRKRESESKVVPVYRPRKIHWVIRFAGWLSAGYLGFMYMIMLTGQAFDLPGTSNENVILVLKVVGVFAIIVNLVCWYLAHSLTSGEDIDR